MAMLGVQLELSYTERSRAPGAIRERWRRRNARKHPVQAVTLPRKTTVAARVELALAAEPDEGLPRRPKTRGECAGIVRPCPFVSCAHHLYLDVNTSGGIKLNFPDIAPDQMDPLWSCALDVADRGEHTLEEAATGMNMTREGVRQLTERSFHKLRGGVFLRVLNNLR